MWTLHSVTAAAHGPPGVGKSLTHWLAARALYNADPAADSRCPGHACAGYKAGALLFCEVFVLSMCTACPASRQAWLSQGSAPQRHSPASAGDATPALSAGAVWHGLRQRGACGAARVPAGRAAGPPEAGVVRAIPPIGIAALLE
jgi:hypothetical protein